MWTDAQSLHLIAMGVVVLCFALGYIGGRQR